MEWLVLGNDWACRQWQQAIESQREDWRCTGVRTAAQASWFIASQTTDAVILCAGAEGNKFWETLFFCPTHGAPWLIGDGWTHPLLDASLSLSASQQLDELWESPSVQQPLPRFAMPWLPVLSSLAEDLLHALDMPERLGARIFLPEMTALCLLRPWLLEDLHGRLYPLCGRRYGLSSGCVERRLRLAVESTWNRGSLDALECFFGQTVDPLRGKPTNKEFLARLRLCLIERTQRAAVTPKQPVLPNRLFTGHIADISSSIQSIYKP